MIRDLLNNTTIRFLHPAVRSLAAVITGTAIDLRGMGRKVLVVLNIGGVEGTTPSAATIIQESDDGTTWFTLHTFATQTAAATLLADLTPTRGRIRAVTTISGGAGAGATLSVAGVIYLERSRPSGIV